MSKSLHNLPQLGRLLARLRRRLALQVWLHGSGRTLAVLALALLFAFVIDWGLQVPAGVRLLNLALLLALPLWMAWRELALRLRRVPDEAGLAVLVERAHPAEQELLVSAVQLARGAEPAIDTELLQRVFERAEERSGQLSLDAVVRPAGPRVSFVAGIACAVLCIVVLGLNRDAAGVFFARILGGSTPWPQRTHLSIEIPGLAMDVEPGAERLDLSLARGSDVPVVVRVEGVVPEEVVLHFESGHQTILGPTGQGLFRTLLRSVQEDVSFWVTGGDDKDGLPLVSIEVLQPPDIAGLAIEVEPPAYSRLAPQLVHDRDAEVLAGSRVRVSVRPTPADATGVARLLPEDRILPLTAGTFPAREAPAEGEVEAQPALAFELVANADLRFRFELTDSRGLTNPDPGLFGISVTADRAPLVEVLAPGRTEVESVAGGALPLRVRARDDFHIGQLSLLLGRTDDEEQPPQELELPYRRATLEDGSDSRDVVWAARRVAVAELAAAGGEAVEGQVYVLTVAAVDERAPVPQRGLSAPVRVRIVSPDEFLRRVQDRLARARTEAETLSELLRGKHESLRELISSVETDQMEGALGPAEFGSALAGARRVQGDARALSRELTSVASSLLYSGLDDRAGPLLELLDEELSELSDRSFHVEPWRELVRRQESGQLGGTGLAARLVEIVGVALETGETDLQAALEALERAQASVEVGSAYDALLDASDAELRALGKLETLLERLAEWDNFQSVLSLTRDILNRQKNLLKRTEQFAKDN